MFAPLDGVAEDPATGSAAAALGAFLVDSNEGDEEKDGVVKVRVEQGVEMGRRSVIGVEVRKEGGVVREVFVAGECVAVMRGTVEDLGELLQ